MMNFLDAARLFQDCWRLYRNYYGRKMSEEDWEKSLDERSGLYKKYQTHIARDMISVVIDEIERMQGEG